MPLDLSHYGVVDGRPDLTPAEHIRLAGNALYRAGECRTIGENYEHYIIVAARHLRAAHLDELADRCDAICEDGFGGGGEPAEIDEELRQLSR